MWETEKGQSKGDVNVGKKVAPLSGGEKRFPPVAEGYQVAGGERQKQASFLSVAAAVDMYMLQISMICVLFIKTFNLTDDFYIFAQLGVSRWCSG